MTRNQCLLLHYVIEFLNKINVIINHKSYYFYRLNINFFFFVCGGDPSVVSFYPFVIVTILFVNIHWYVFVGR